MIKKLRYKLAWLIMPDEVREMVDDALTVQRAYIHSHNVYDWFNMVESADTYLTRARRKYGRSATKKLPGLHKNTNARAREARESRTQTPTGNLRTQPSGVG